MRVINHTNNKQHHNTLQYHHSLYFMPIYMDDELQNLQASAIVKDHSESNIDIWGLPSIRKSTEQFMEDISQRQMDLMIHQYEFLCSKQGTT